MDLPKITNGFTENHKPIPDNKPDNKLTDKVTRLNNNTLIMTAEAENLSSASLILDNVVGTTGFFKIWDYQTDDKFKIWVNSQKLEYLNFKTKQQIYKELFSKGLKKCTGKCKQIKELSEFYFCNKRNKYESACICCRREYEECNKERRRKNRQRHPLRQSHVLPERQA